jgi:hypothetical protein
MRYSTERHCEDSTKEACPCVRLSALLLTRILVLTGLGAVSLSSFGGEGQGEEAVYATDTTVHGRQFK